MNTQRTITAFVLTAVLNGCVTMDEYTTPPMTSPAPTTHAPPPEAKLHNIVKEAAVKTAVHDITFSDRLRVQTQGVKGYQFTAQDCEKIAQHPDSLVSPLGQEICDKAGAKPENFLHHLEGKAQCKTNKYGVDECIFPTPGQ